MNVVRMFLNFARKMWLEMIRDLLLLYQNICHIQEIFMLLHGNLLVLLF